MEMKAEPLKGKGKFIKLPYIDRIEDVAPVGSSVVLVYLADVAAAVEWLKLKMSISIQSMSAPKFINDLNEEAFIALIDAAFADVTEA